MTEFLERVAALEREVATLKDYLYYGDKEGTFDSLRTLTEENKSLKLQLSAAHTKINNLEIRDRVADRRGYYLMGVILAVQFGRLVMDKTDWEYIKYFLGI